MIAAEIIRQVRSAGGQITVDGDDLVLTVPRPLPADLLDRLAAHKPATLAALACPDLRATHRQGPVRPLRGPGDGGGMGARA